MDSALWGGRWRPPSLHGFCGFSASVFFGEKLVPFPPPGGRALTSVRASALWRGVAGTYEVRSTAGRAGLAISRQKGISSPSSPVEPVDPAVWGHFGRAPALGAAVRLWRGVGTAGREVRFESGMRGLSPMPFPPLFVRIQNVFSERALLQLQT